MDIEIKKDKENLVELLNFTDIKKNIILNSLCSSNIFYKPIDISDDIFKDTEIDKWISNLPVLEGSKVLIKNIIRNPINNLDILKKRQLSYTDYDLDFSLLKEYEDDILWLYNLNDNFKTNSLVYSLFPSGYLISYINNLDIILEIYHIYKIYFTPINIIIYPLVSLFAPLYYIKKYLKFNISIKTYFTLLYNFIKLLFSNSGGIKIFILKVITISFYLFLFVYNIYQILEYSYLLYNTRDKLYNRLNNLISFLNESRYILNKINITYIQQFINIKPYDINLKLNNTMSSIYKLWKDKSMKNYISNILLSIYTVDIINSINKLKNRRNWCLTDYNAFHIKLWNMKNPLLSSEQIGNPIDLSKNIIITGPNAAGKTTYVKSILSNIILSQTFGIANAIKAHVKPYDNILSLMRIEDILGCKSYFEAEAEYCNTMMKNALYLSENNMNGLYLMDEPMHSTPPTEGISTAFAVAEYIGNLKGIDIILTTHFHKLTLLEDIYPDKFINLCVNAIPNTYNDGFIFPYNINRGYSYQSIAIELLNSKHFPHSVIQSAINMKNKLYTEINSR